MTEDGKASLTPAATTSGWVVRVARSGAARPQGARPLVQTPRRARRFPDDSHVPPASYLTMKPSWRDR